MPAVHLSTVKIPAVTNLRLKSDSSGSNKSQSEVAGSVGWKNLEPVLPPDETLEYKMEIIMQKRLYGVSMDTFYNTCWKESSFYHLYMESQDGKTEVQVGEWEEDSSGFVGDWDGEHYTQKRLVTYQYTRDPDTMGYNLGKPVVKCTQSQYLRRDGSDHAVIAMKLSMDGEVISDSFVVHIRGIATRLQDPSNPSITALDLSFGVFCQFTRHVLIAKQIGSITKSATVESLDELVSQMKEACGALEEGPDGEIF